MVRIPRQVPTRSPLSPEQIASAMYVGSPEHKTERWWGGLPRAYVRSGGSATRPKKQLTTICPLTTEDEQTRATGWVRDALTLKQFRYREGDKDFPVAIWYREASNGRIWFGYCVNSTLGQYKGWPIDEEEWRARFD